MKRFAIFLIMLLASVANAIWYGEHDIDEFLTFAVTTSKFSTGAGFDADSVPTYSIYEDETGAEVVGPANMAKLDDAGSTGFYTERVQLTDANFDVGKMYTIYIEATVDSVAGIASHAFKIRAAPIAIASSIADVQTEVDKIGTIPALDGAGQTIGAAIAKIADDNGGASYDAELHSLKEIRDQGDSAWLTGTAAATANTADADGDNVQDGSVTANLITDTYTDDGVKWTIADNDGSGLDVRMTFTLGTDKTASSFQLNGYFDGGPNRYVNMFAWNYMTTAFDQLSDAGSRLDNESSDQNYGPFILLTSHQQSSDGEVIVRFFSDNSNSGDDLYLDQVLIDAIGTGGFTLNDIADAVASHNVLTHADHASLGFQVHMAGVITSYAVTTQNTASSFTCSSLPATTNYYQYHRIRVHDEINDIYSDSWILSMDNAGAVILGRALAFIPDTDSELFLRDSIISPVEIWADETAATRILTALDEDDTAIDLDNSATDLSAITGDKNSYKATGFAVASDVTTAHSTTDAKIDTTDSLVTSSHSTTDTLINGIDDNPWDNGTRTLTANTNLNDPTAASIATAVWNKDISGVVTSDFAGTILNAIKARWDALTTTGGFLEIDIKAVDGTAVKSTNGNVHALPGNI